MNIINLKLLADYLMKGELKAQFDMRSFTSPDIRAEEENVMTDCGTCGCAVGHAPFVGLEKRKDEDWIEYSERVFELTAESNRASKHNSWLWCFSGSWESSPENTAKRIYYLIKHGTPPEWYLESSTMFDCHRQYTKFIHE